MTGVGDNPKAGLRDGFRHLDRDFYRIERIMVALDNERTGFDGREVGRSEVQVVVAIGEAPRTGEYGPDLLIASGMATTKDLPVSLGQAVRILPHDGSSLRRKIAGGTDQHHGLDTLRLAGGKVEEDVAATADSQSFERHDFQVVEER